MRAVALHGMLGAASDWDFLRGELPVPLEAPDLWAWDCDLDAPPIDADIVIGYSMGGRLALHALAGVRRAAVIVSAHTGLADPEARAARLAADREWAGKARTAGWAAFLEEWNAQGVFGGGAFAQRRGALEPRRGAIAAAFERWSLGRQGDLLSGLARVTIPVLWVNGERDERFVAIGAEACAVLPQGEHVVVGGCGHRVPWEAPREFRRLIKGFVSRHLLCS